MTAPAVVSGSARCGDLNLRGTPLEFLGSAAAANTFAVLAAGEIIADKTPAIPNRTDPFPLAGRAMTGGLCGAAIALSSRKPLVWGALLGGAAAIGGAFLGYQLRKRATRQAGLPDFVVALCEDALAVGSALAAVRP